MAEQVSRDRGYRSDTIAISRDMGPLNRGGGFSGTLGPKERILTPPLLPHTLRAQILKNFKILKFSSELEIFKRATHQTPVFLWGILEVRIEHFKRDWNFRRTPQLVGSFEALRFIEAEEKRKNKAEKGKRREKLEKRKQIYSHSLLAVR